MRAHDGIQETGVSVLQRCDVPIWGEIPRGVWPCGERSRVGRGGDEQKEGVGVITARRSEERRVGKESRWRWALYDIKKEAVAYQTSEIRVKDICSACRHTVIGMAT